MSLKMLDSNRIMMFSSVHLYQDARIFYKEAKTLANFYQVEFYAVGSESHELENENLNITLLPKKSRIRRLKTILDLKKRIRDSDAKYYHFHDPELLMLVPYIRKKKGAIIIYDMHENFPESIKTKEWIPKFLRKFLAIFIKHIEKRLLAQLDGIIFAEKSYSKYYRDINVPKIEVYNYPIYIQRPISIIRYNTIKLIYVGRVAEIRGIFQMLEVVKSLTADGVSVNLKIIGSAEETIKSQIEIFIQKHNLEGVIEYFNYVDYSDIWEFYKNADIGLCLLHPVPNYLESLATKIFEYMAAEIPMIVSDFPAWNKLIYESKCGLTVNPFHIDEIKESILRLKEDKEAQILGRNGRKIYEEKYNWNIEGEKLLQFYKKFI